MRCIFPSQRETLSLYCSLSMYALRYLLECDVEHHAHRVKWTIESTRNCDLVITLLSSNIAWISPIFLNLFGCVRCCLMIFVSFLLACVNPE